MPEEDDVAVEKKRTENKILELRKEAEFYMARTIKALEEKKIVSAKLAADALKNVCGELVNDLEYLT